MTASESRLPVRTIVVFDLDGTLTLRDTSVPFLRWVAGTGATARALVGAGLRSPALLYRAVVAERRRSSPGLGSVRGRWEGLMHETAAAALRGRTKAELSQAGEAFAAALAEGGLSPGARPRISHHRERGHILVLASASLSCYVAPLARLLGFHECVATRLSFEDGVADGRFHGLPCWGLEKLRRVRNLLGERGELVHAYGDGVGDAPLLSAARHPVRVRGGL